MGARDRRRVGGGFGLNTVCSYPSFKCFAWDFPASALVCDEYVFILAIKCRDDYRECFAISLTTLEFCHYDTCQGKADCYHIMHTEMEPSFSVCCEQMTLYVYISFFLLRAVVRDRSLYHRRKFVKMHQEVKEKKKVFLTVEAKRLSKKGGTRRS